MYIYMYMHIYLRWEIVEANVILSEKADDTP